MFTLYPIISIDETICGFCLFCYLNFILNWFPVSYHQCVLLQVRNVPFLFAYSKITPIFIGRSLSGSISTYDWSVIPKNLHHYNWCLCWAIYHLFRIMLIYAYLDTLISLKRSVKMSLNAFPSLWIKDTGWFVG